MWMAEKNFSPTIFILILGLNSSCQAYKASTFIAEPSQQLKKGYFGYFYQK